MNKKMPLLHVILLIIVVVAIWHLIIAPRLPQLPGARRTTPNANAA